MAKAKGKAAPSWMSPYAKAIWRKHLDLLTDPRDEQAYAMLCVSLAEYRYCLETVSKDGRVSPTAAGNPKAHPLLATLKQHSDTACKLLSKFGMTPADREEKDEAGDGDAAKLNDLLTG